MGLNGPTKIILYFIRTTKLNVMVLLQDHVNSRIGTVNLGKTNYVSITIKNMLNGKTIPSNTFAVPETEPV